MQAGRAAATAAAAQAIAQSDRGEILAEARDVVGREEHAPVFASPADGDERHFFIDQLAERSADFAGIAVAGAHANDLATRARPLGAVLGIDELAAKAIAELFGVLALGKAEDVHVRAVSIKRMAARGKRQVLAEKTNRHIVAASAAISRKRHLMRPIAINRVLAEFASALHASVSFVGSRPRSRYLLGEGGRAFAEHAGGVGAVVAEVEQKVNDFLLGRCAQAVFALCLHIDMISGRYRGALPHMATGPVSYAASSERNFQLFHLRQCHLRNAVHEVGEVLSVDSTDPRESAVKGQRFY